MSLLLLRLYLSICMCVRLSKSGVISNFSSICHPAEEGKYHTIIFLFGLNRQLESTSISVQKNEMTIATCAFLEKCFDYHRTYYTTHISENENSFNVTLIVEIHNVTRGGQFGSDSNWRVVHSRMVSGNCTVTVYSKPSFIECNKRIVENIIQVSCWSSKMYPKGKCQLFVYFNEMRVSMSRASIIERHYTISDDPEYYSTNCLLNMPITNLKKGTYDVLMSIVHNVAGIWNEQDIVTYKTIIVIDSPSVALKDCPMVIEEKTIISCTCERSDNSIIDAFISWYDINHTSINSKKGSNILNFNATRSRRKDKIEYHCEASNTHVWNNSISSTYYKPQVYSKLQDIDCSITVLKSTVDMCCFTKRVYPGALCQIQIFYTNGIANTLQQKLRYENEVISSDPIFYKSSCSFSVPRKSLNRGLNNICLTMYPNITGTESDMKLGMNKSFEFALAEEFELLAQHRVIEIIVVGIIMLIFCTILTWICRNKGAEACSICTDKKTIRNDYDEINEGYIVPVESSPQEEELFRTNTDSSTSHNVQENANYDEFIVEYHVYEFIDEEVDEQNDN